MPTVPPSPDFFKQNIQGDLSTSRRKTPPDWNEWGRHVLIELERLNESYEQLRDDIPKLETEIALLKFKCGIVGTISGMIPVTILIAIQWLTTNGS